MSYLNFDKKGLVNLEYSLHKEVLRTNRVGSYSCTTLAGCNTRKYHGLLVSSLPDLDTGKHLLLSSLDESIIQHDAAFNIGIHKYKGEVYEPKGHKYIRNFESDPMPKTTYRVGDVVLTKEKVLVENTAQVLIKYTLVEANSPIGLRLKPFLAFRNMHSLSKSNLNANTKFKPSNLGINIKLYDPYPSLHLQLSNANEFVPNPCWYNDIEYFKEKDRGYDSHEDLYVPGYFEVPLKRGESIVFSASIEEANPTQLKRKFTIESKKSVPREDFWGCLANSANQFFTSTDEGPDVLAGYPWYNGRVNQTFVALPGLYLATGDLKRIENVIDTNINRTIDGLFPKYWGNKDSLFDSADASLWFVWAIQQLLPAMESPKYVWRKYGDIFCKIIDAYTTGIHPHITYTDKGLIEIYQHNVAQTWMDGYSDGAPVTPRYGLPVEINALWYNALRFIDGLAKDVGEKDLKCRLDGYIKSFEDSFLDEFWCSSEGYLADSIYQGTKNWQIMPNMVIAAGLKFSPLTREMKKSIISIAKRELLTPRGLRTLSPRDEKYEGAYKGNEHMRERSIHQGTVHPWLVGFYIEAYMSVHKRSGLTAAKRIMDGFEQEMTEHCIGTFSELYAGNPPHQARGAVSQAWSVGQILRSFHIIEKYEQE